MADDYGNRRGLHVGDMKHITRDRGWPIRRVVSEKRTFLAATWVRRVHEAKICQRERPGGTETTCKDTEAQKVAPVFEEQEGKPVGRAPWVSGTVVFGKVGELGGGGVVVFCLSGKRVSGFCSVAPGSSKSDTLGLWFLSAVLLKVSISA